MNKEWFPNLYERFNSSGLSANDFCANEEPASLKYSVTPKSAIDMAVNYALRM